MKKFKCTIDGELAEGCPIGDRETVYNWMVEKYLPLYNKKTITCNNRYLFY